ncbi:MAG: hypothetical protein ABJN42_24805 [Roseibium sp.]|uniref:hypothetical protein n=1 Tax=Roseibium sp. TaxID=1936156 RepID=UPI003296A241
MANGDIQDPIDYGSIVRNNLMKRPGYMPYCGEAHLVRLSFDGTQFVCTCGYRTEFTEDFIAGYKSRWHTPEVAQ